MSPRPLAPGESLQDIGHVMLHGLSQEATFSPALADETQDPTLRRSCRGKAALSCRALRGGLEASLVAMLNASTSNRKIPPSRSSSVVSPIGQPTARLPKYNMTHQMPVATSATMRIVPMGLPLGRSAAACWCLTFSTHRTSRFMDISDVLAVGVCAPRQRRQLPIGSKGREPFGWTQRLERKLVPNPRSGGRLCLEIAL